MSYYENNFIEQNMENFNNLEQGYDSENNFYYLTENEQTNSINDILGRKIIFDAYNEIEKEKRRKEAMNPEKYIKLDYSFKKKLLGGYEASGSIFNNAEETYYKDTEVRMYFLDAVGDKMDSISTIIFKEFGPGDRVPFEMQHDGPKKTQMVTLTVVSAKVSS